MLEFDKINNKDIIVTQVKSELGSLIGQKQTLRALGLRGINSQSQLKCDRSIYGMLIKVRHLIEVKLK